MNIQTRLEQEKVIRDILNQLVPIGEEIHMQLKFSIDSVASYMKVLMDAFLDSFNINSPRKMNTTLCFDSEGDVYVFWFCGDEIDETGRTPQGEVDFVVRFPYLYNNCNVSFALRFMKAEDGKTIAQPLGAPGDIPEEIAKFRAYNYELISPILRSVSVTL